MPEYGSCVRPSRTIHCVKSHFEVRSVEQLLNGFEVKEMLHSLNINSDILNNFDNKHRLCWPLHLSEMIHSNFMEIHSFQKVEICDKVFLYFGSLFTSVVIFSLFLCGRFFNFIIQHILVYFCYV